jgi:hypothetical protein
MGGKAGISLPLPSRHFRNCNPLHPHLVPYPAADILLIGGANPLEPAAATVSQRTRDTAHGVFPAGYTEGEQLAAKWYFPCGTDGSTIVSGCIAVGKTPQMKARRAR